MKVDVLLGMQWGDEGKGKVVDYLAPEYNVIARFQGGPNAGHTLYINDKKFVLHTIPSGIFREELINIIGNGVVIDPVTFAKEIENIEPFCSNLDKRLFISSRAHLILPTHKLLDEAYEKAKGNTKIGSTLKGIGPTYTDKCSRQGIRAGDALLPNFKEKVNSVLSRHMKILEAHNINPPSDNQLMDFYAGLDVLRRFNISETEFLIDDFLQNGQNILAEGAQGTLLDLDFGSYPYVTSSNTLCSAASTGLGYSPRNTGSVYGLFKAYCTRVGSGPFPTELNDEAGEKLRKQGNEFGSTTGRPRRCGWLDLVALKYAVMINGANRLIMTKADVMSDFDTIRVCTDYSINGKTTQNMPFCLNSTPVSPIYKDFKGWSGDITKIRAKKDLPCEFLTYKKFIENYLKVPISIVSVSPDRNAIIEF